MWGCGGRKTPTPLTGACFFLSFTSFYLFLVGKGFQGEPKDHTETFWLIVLDITN